MPETIEMLTLFGWFVVAAVVLLVGYFVAMAVRRWVQRDEPVENFTFQDLREMRDRGDITPREFSAMRAALLAEYDVGEDAEAKREVEGEDEGGTSPRE